jgi:hypothetical protein
MVNNSKGIILFAYNSGYDYVSIANVSAMLAKHYTGLPVTLITDVFGALVADLDYIDNIIDCDAPGTNERVFRGTHDETTKKMNWKNLNRAAVYELSPYDKTLLIDVDYLMFNATMASVFETDIEFSCHNKAFDLSFKQSFDVDQRLNEHGIPMLWATVIYFKKCERAKAIFEMMDEVKANYSYYAKAYGFKEKPFRNDFALSVAHHAIDGYGSDRSQFFPFNLMTLPPSAPVIKFKTDPSLSGATGSIGELVYEYKVNSTLYRSSSQSNNVHIMNKESFTETLCKDIADYYE